MLGAFGAGDFSAAVRRAAVPGVGASLVLQGPAGAGNASVPAAAASLAAGSSAPGTHVGAVLWRNPSLWGLLEAGASFASDAALGLRLLRGDGGSSTTAVQGLTVADSVTIALPLGSSAAAAAAVLAGPANGSAAVGALQCRSWDATRSIWATEGCTTLYSAPDATPVPGSGAVSCRCSHLSEFALVRSPAPPPPKVDVVCDAVVFHTVATTATVAYAGCVGAAGAMADKLCDCVNTFNCQVRKYATCPGEVGARVTASQNGQLCTLFGMCI